MSEDHNWSIEVTGSLLKQPLSLTERDFASFSHTFSPSPYLDVPSTDVVPFKEVFNQLSLTENPSHVIFYGSDRFTAEISMDELEVAFFLFRDQGQPLKKGYPVRLYVPDGTSQCLNIKSVIRLEPVKYEGDDQDKPSSFGFKNTVSPEELLKR